MSTSTVTIDPARLAEITRLTSGAGASVEDVCVMQAVDYVTRGELSDHPPCACPLITNYAIRLNDQMPDDQRQRLLPYIARIAGSRSPREVEQQRAYLAVTWAVKRFAPRALDAYGYTEQAATLRALPDITDRETALQAKSAAAANAAAYADAAAAYAYAAADAAAAAAYADAYAAAWDEALACLDALLAVGAPTESAVAS